MHYSFYFFLAQFVGEAWLHLATMTTHNLVIRRLILHILPWLMAEPVKRPVNGLAAAWQISTSSIGYLSSIHPSPTSLDDRKHKLAAFEKWTSCS